MYTPTSPGGNDEADAGGRRRCSFEGPFNCSRLRGSGLPATDSAYDGEQHPDHGTQSAGDAAFAFRSSTKSPMRRYNRRLGSWQPPGGQAGMTVAAHCAEEEALQEFQVSSCESRS